VTSADITGVSMFLLFVSFLALIIAVSEATASSNIDAGMKSRPEATELITVVTSCPDCSRPITVTLTSMGSRLGARYECDCGGLVEIVMDQPIIRRRR
jgi:predicted RNA-binding Zn-ribbon protein involved in translation (DUF1610 family)